MTKQLIAQTANGLDVYMDMEKCHALTHIAKSPKLLDFIKKVIPTMDATQDVIRIDRDMGETAGMTDMVETDENDEIIYAMRPLRSIYSRFAKNRQAQPTNWITIDLRKSEDAAASSEKAASYDLYTAFVGKMTPSFPGGNYLPEQSKEFWSKHALALDSVEIVPGTETTECPW